MWRPSVGVSGHSNCYSELEGSHCGCCAVRVFHGVMIGGVYAMEYRFWRFGGGAYTLSWTLGKTRKIMQDEVYFCEKVWAREMVEGVRSKGDWGPVYRTRRWKQRTQILAAHRGEMEEYVDGIIFMALQAYNNDNQNRQNAGGSLSCKSD